MKAKNTEEPGDALKPRTVDLLAGLAGESFERRAELDGSVWRSLPFFAATLAIAAALIGAAAKDVPPLAGAPLPLVLHTLLIASTASFDWALRWFWTVVRPREYECPAAETRYVATPTTDPLDAAVVADLQLFMAEQYGNAARTNFAHDAAKMKARSQCCCS